MQGCVQYCQYRDIPPVYTAGCTGTGHFGKFGTTSIPVPDTEVGSVQHQYRYRILRQVRYSINAGDPNIGNFGKTSTLVPDISASSVRHQYHFGKFSTIWISVPPVPVPPLKTVPDTWVGSVPHKSRYQTLRYVRSSINDGTGHFGKIGTTEIPVPDTLVSSVRHQYGYPLYRYGRLNRICYRYR